MRNWMLWEWICRLACIANYVYAGFLMGRGILADSTFVYNISNLFVFLLTGWMFYTFSLYAREKNTKAHYIETG
jgi:hypothetical protein